MSFRSFFALLSFSLLTPLVAHAGTGTPVENIYGLIARGFEDAWPAEYTARGLKAEVGVSVGVAPEYQGAKSYRMFTIPLLRLTYRDAVALHNTKLTVNLLRFDRLRVGVVAKYLFGRRQSSNPVLAGLDKVKDTIEVGGFVRYDVKHLVITADVRDSISRDQGLSAQLTLAQGLYKSKKLRLGIAASAIWGSRERLQTNFGVTEAEAAAAPVGLRPFHADSGLYQVNLFLGGEYLLDDHWRLGATIGYTRLLADAAESPIVADYGSPNMATVGVGLLYRF